MNTSDFSKCGRISFHAGRRRDQILGWLFEDNVDWKPSMGCRAWVWPSGWKLVRGRTHINSIWKKTLLLFRHYLMYVNEWLQPVNLVVSKSGWLARLDSVDSGSSVSRSTLRVDGNFFSANAETQLYLFLGTQSGMNHYSYFSNHKR